MSRYSYNYNYIKKKKTKSDGDFTLDPLCKTNVLRFF